jgi:DNA-directed RNA polymerase specialized sigma24 family protein
MVETGAFAELLQRARSGGQQAAAELFRQFEPAIRLEVRLRLRDRRLRRLFDSSDVCQEVLATFFARAAAGEFSLEQPHDLIKLLVVIARRKLALQVRKALGPTRNPGALDDRAPEEWGVADPRPGPEQCAADGEMLRELADRFSGEERRLAEMRAAGLSWPEIAAELGGQPQARRKQLSRAVARVLKELGLDEECHV